MTTRDDTGVAAAYAEFLAVAAAAPAALRASRPNLTALDEADGELFLAGLIEGGLQFVAADSARPAFVPWVTPTRRWADNGRDSVYWMAPVDDRHRYRVSGARGEEYYLSFTLYAGDPGHPQNVVLNTNHLGLGVASGDRFSLDLEPPAEACYIISRQYFTRPESQRAGKFSIEVIDGPPATTPTASELAGRWSAATSFLRAMTTPRAGSVALPAYVSTTPNVMGDPSAWTETEGGGRGTPDQTYASGPYALAPDEALVLTVTFPPAAYCSVALWNRFGQTVDRRFHRSTLNHTEAVTGSTGEAVIVVAARDPGVPNWLDTGGRPAGSLFWRFLLAEHPPTAITSQVVLLDQVRSRFGANMDGER